GRSWEYRAKRWLRRSIATDDPNRDRWPGHRIGTALRDGLAPGAFGGGEPPERSLELVRAARYTGYWRLLDRMAARSDGGSIGRREASPRPWSKRRPILARPSYLT